MRKEINETFGKLGESSKQINEGIKILEKQMDESKERLLIC